MKLTEMEKNGILTEPTETKIFKRIETNQNYITTKKNILKLKRKYLINIFKKYIFLSK